MSSSITIFSMLASLAFVFILIDPSLASNLDNVCSKTDDKNLCKGLLKGYSASSEDSDYGTLCKNSLDLTFETTKEVITRLSSVMDLPGFDVNYYLFRCLYGYANMESVFDVMKGTIQTSDYKHIENQIKNATEQVRVCDPELMKREDFRTDFSKLSNEIKILCEAITSSAKYWKGGDK